MNILVDNIAHTLCSRLGRKCDSARADGRYLLHQLLGKAVNAQRRERQTDLFVISPREQLVGQLAESRIVTDRERAKRYFVKTGVLIKPPTLSVEHIGTLFAHRAVYHSRLTEAAAAYASAIHLGNDTVMHRLYVRHNEFVGEIYTVKIGDYLLLYSSRNIVVLRLE